jgi:Xaa-Pro aminopeptidase
LAYAVVHADGTADLFVEGEKVGDDVRAHLGNGVRLHERDEFETYLRSMADKLVAVDPERSVAAISQALEEGGGRILSRRDPAVLPKAIKNKVEISGHQAAQARDGAAVSRFLKWIEEEAPKGGIDEMIAQDKLLEFREALGGLKDLSFDTISAFGPNGALPHYKGAAESNLPFAAGTLYLVDSGGQYQDGTTDITRTVPIGEPTAEMVDRFTRVLQGHIAIATALFPKGTRGSSSTASPAGRCGMRGSTMPMVPVTAWALSLQSMKGRSALRLSAARNRAATNRFRRG